MCHSFDKLHIATVILESSVNTDLLETLACVLLANIANDLGLISFIYTASFSTR